MPVGTALILFCTAGGSVPNRCGRPRYWKWVPAPLSSCSGLVAGGTLSRQWGHQLRWKRRTTTGRVSRLTAATARVDRGGPGRAVERKRVGGGALELAQHVVGGPARGGGRRGGDGREDRDDCDDRDGGDGSDQRHGSDDRHDRDVRADGERTGAS